MICASLHESATCPDRQADRHEVHVSNFIDYLSSDLLLTSPAQQHTLRPLLTSQFLTRMMYRALEIEDIPFDIFQRLSLPHMRGPARIRATSDLAALARTCRAFKEPALNLLWRTLIDLSPLARCLPEASCRSSFEPDDSCSAVVRSFQTLLLLCSLTRIFRFFLTFLRSSIRLEDQLPRANGTHFEAIHIVFDAYSTSIKDSTGNPSAWPS